MPGPTTATLKRLFAASENRCAFPGCESALVTDETVTGEIGHIEAQSEGSPRYNPNQADEDRRGFDNLLLLCPIHHKLIDADPTTYTVERLRQIKTEHEARCAGGPEPDDEVVARFLVYVEATVHGDKATSDEVRGAKVTVELTHEDTQVTIPSPEAVAAHRTALREKLEADARARWGGMDLYIRVEGAALPIEASPYQTGRLGPRKDLLKTLCSANRLLVLGEPGSGKTVSLKRLTWELCEGEGTDVPVPVPLRDYAGKSLAEWVLSFLRETGHLQLDDEKALEAFLDEGDCRCIFLFDGLNEVAPPYRDRLIEDLQLWVTAHPRHPVVLTSRPQDELWRRLRGEVEWVVVVQPVGDEQMAACLEAHMGEQGQALYGRLQEMARTPLILWLIKGAGAPGESLPGNRGELYERFVARTLQRGTERLLDVPITDRVKKKALAGLAYHLSREQRLACPREEAVEVVARALDDGQAEEVVKACARHGLLAGEETVWFAPHQTVQEHFAALALREMVEQEQGLCLGGRLRHGVRRVLAGKAAGLASLAADDWWTETFVQLAGLVDDADWLVQEVARANPWLAWRCAEEGRDVSEETRKVVERRSVRLLGSKQVTDRRRAAQALARIQSARVVDPLFKGAADDDPEVAGLAAQALLQMNDTTVKSRALALAHQPKASLYRAGLAYVSALFDQLGCPRVWVPPGPFLMGSGEKDIQAYGGEMPQREVALRGYWIGQYPVTNEAYRVFVEGGGYHTQAYWTEAGWAQKEQNGWTEPGHWNDEKYNHPQQPVVGVSWYEALAYCRWLSERTGMEVRLPSEAEWEKAARGTDGRIYPWGDEFDKSKCNTNESVIGTTTPVGEYSPQGDSHCGCADMAGNVWEWCRTKWEIDYEYYVGNDDPEGDARRVRRGGAFNFNAWYARSAFRLDFTPDDRYRSYGFRVIVTCPRSL